MGARTRHGPARRAACLLTVALASAVVLTVAAVAPAKPASPASPRAAPAHRLAPPASVQPSPASAARPAVPAAPALTARDRGLCPPAATACVELARRITWLQSGAKVSFGPVWMEPGPPGSPHATPRGVFHVSWKAGPGYISNIYHEPMPWAVFFAPGGIAFHGGSLTKPSHGCVHLTIANALYFNEHLPVGAEVAVF